MSPVGIGVLVFLILFIVALIITNVKIVPQSRAYVVERLGAYRMTWQTGIHFKIPFFERIAKNVSLKEQLLGLLNDTPQTASDLAKFVTNENGEGISVQKASSLLRQMALEGVILVKDVKIAKKGAQKGYYLKPEEPEVPETETETENSEG